MSVMTAPQFVLPADRPLTVADLDRSTDRNVTRPPELAVEIASPSTAGYDRKRKKAVYAEFGIPAYWIVVPDSEEPSLTAFGLTDGSYAEVGRAMGGERFAAPTPFPVEVVPADLVAGPWRGGR